MPPEMAPVEMSFVLEYALLQTPGPLLRGVGPLVRPVPPKITLIFLSFLDIFNILEVLMFLSVSVLSSSYYIRLLRFIYFSSKINKVQRYSVLKFDNSFYNLIFILLLINILTVFFHNIIFLIILKYVIFLFI